MIDSTDIEKYLAKGGFAFEFECINQFKKMGFGIQPSLHYYDDKMNQYREVDFIAYKNVYFKEDNFSFNISLVVECKAHIAPLIATSNESPLKKDLIISNILSSLNFGNIKKKISENGGHSSFTFGLMDNEIITQSIIEFSNKDSKDRVFSAMMQSLNASLYLKNKSNESDNRFCNIYIPIVIFDNELFVVSHDNTQLVVNKSSFFKASKFYAFDDHPYNIFHVVSKGGIEEYCELVMNEIVQFTEDYDEDIREIIKNNPNNTGKGKYR
ncbi:MAG: hypothetical protein PHQ74_02190 [Crocinitomicaceae bacterium]|nr:hypothetical protein [Crocinitomicaceae bacterium]